LSRDPSEYRRMLEEAGVAGYVKQRAEGLVKLVESYWEDVILPLAKLDAVLESFMEGEEYGVIAERAGRRLEDLISRFSSLRRDLFYAFHGFVDELLVGRDDGGLALLSQSLGVDIGVVEKIAGMQGYPKAEASRSTVDARHLLATISIAIDALLEGRDTVERMITVAIDIEEAITERDIDGLWNNFRLELFHNDVLFLGMDVVDVLFDLYEVIDDALRGEGGG